MISVMAASINLRDTHFLRIVVTLNSHIDNTLIFWSKIQSQIWISWGVSEFSCDIKTKDLLGS